MNGGDAHSRLSLNRVTGARPSLWTTSKLKLKPSIRSGLVLDINAETEQVSIADEKTGAVMRAAFGNISCLADMKPLSEVRYCVSERAVGSPRLLAVKRRPTVSPFREAVKAAAVRQATWATKTAGSTRQRRSGSDADKWERVQLPAVA